MPLSSGDCIVAGVTFLCRKRVQVSSRRTYLFLSPKNYKLELDKKSRIKTFVTDMKNSSQQSHCRQSYKHIIMENILKYERDREREFALEQNLKVLFPAVPLVSWVAVCKFFQPFTPLFCSLCVVETTLSTLVNRIELYEELSPVNR